MFTRIKQLPVTALAVMIVVQLVFVLQSNKKIFVMGTPYILLRNKSPKCFQVTSPQSKKALIQYNAPDLVMITLNEDQIINEALKQDAANKEKVEEDGLDAMYNERLQKRMEELKKAHMKDINISISPRDSEGLMIKNTRTDSDGQVLPRKVRHQAEEKIGEIIFNMDEQDAHLEICIQSYAATFDNPSRVSIKVLPYKTDEEREIDKYEAALQKQNDPKVQLEVAEQNELLKVETSRISAELMRMKRRSESIVRDIEFAKQREREFQQQSVSLSKAVKYYPMFRICILLMAGFFQVSYVVEYMKSKHIY